MNGLAFTPTTVSAAPGDTLLFTFQGGMHNVVQGDYSNPCKPLAGGFSSPFITGGTSDNLTVAADIVYEITVEDKEPTWFYCSVDLHCEEGMVGLVNEP
jgi:plastocyanin